MSVSQDYQCQALDKACMYTLDAILEIWFLWRHTEIARVGGQNFDRFGFYSKVDFLFPNFLASIFNLRNQFISSSLQFDQN
jgi:hypothetical protein